MIFKFLGTCLPDVFSKNFSGGIVYDVGCCMVPGKGHPSFFIYLPCGNVSFPNLKMPIWIFHGMDDYAIVVLDIHYLVNSIICRDCSYI